MPRSAGEAACPGVPINPCGAWQPHAHLEFRVEAAADQFCPGCCDQPSDKRLQPVTPLPEKVTVSPPLHSWG